MELGCFSPEKENLDELTEGMIGYVLCNIKQPKICLDANGTTL